MLQWDVWKESRGRYSTGGRSGAITAFVRYYAAPGRSDRDDDASCAPCLFEQRWVVGAENLCHQAILMDHACCAVTPPDPEMVQVGDAVGQWAERRGLLQARPVSAGSMGLSLPRGQ